MAMAAPLDKNGLLPRAAPFLAGVQLAKDQRLLFNPGYEVLPMSGFGNYLTLVRR